MNPEMNAIPSSAHRRWFIPLIAAAGLLVAGGGLFVKWNRRVAPVPAIATNGLDPVVAKLIEDTLGSVRSLPGSGERWGKLGSVLFHYDFPEESGFAFDRAEQLAPNDARWPYLHALLLMPRDPKAATKRLRRAVKASGDRPDMPRLQFAQWLAEHGEIQEAEEQFSALLRSATNHPPALLGLAWLRRAQGRLDESRMLLNRCLEDPHTANAAHVLLAQVEQALGNVPAARAAARRVASLPPDELWPDPFWNEAAAYWVGKKAALQEASSLMDRGRFEEALKRLEIITRDYPDDDEGWYLAGWALNRAQRPEEAERALREHLRLAPLSPRGRSQLAVALLSQNRAAEAILILEAALKLKPTWRELHFNLGYACVQLGRDDDAIGHLRTALALDPNFVPTYTALAELLLRRGDRVEALRLSRQALEIEPADSRALELLKRIPARE